MGAIFLSASVPEVGREPYDRDIEPQIIQAAVSALATVVLGRRILVWGGHPAITPMLWASAKDLGVKYRKSVQLFQSQFFEDDFPKENRHFKNVTYVPAVGNSQRRSLTALRRKMLLSQKFDAAVFIGGMDGAIEEHQLFTRLHPGAKCVPVGLSGGAARLIATQFQYASPVGFGPLDFVRLFYRELSISPSQVRKA